ncbi:unnamed protein product [Leptosia nina]|uniref:Uncharacterized protein n=1 Tax=Leptosia nina TaxID=320188 RepID=A0AAV1K3X0_9NEOP
MLALIFRISTSFSATTSSIKNTADGIYCTLSKSICLSGREIIVVKPLKSYLSIESYLRSQYHLEFDELLRVSELRILEVAKTIEVSGSRSNLQNSNYFWPARE